MTWTCCAARWWPRSSSTSSSSHTACCPSTFGEGQGPSLYIIDVSTGRLTEVAKYTPLYQRYSGAVRLSRVYVRPDQIEAARALMARLLGQAVQS